MYDQRLFMKTLSRFSVVLPEHHNLDAAALAELTKSVTAVLGLGGSGVTMAEEGQLQFVTAVSPDSKELERSQEDHQEGPCRDAYETGEVVRGHRCAPGVSPMAGLLSHRHPPGGGRRCRDPDARW